MEKTSPLVVERSYDAPPEQIWQAITDPEQMKKWYFDLPGFRAEVGGAAPQGRRIAVFCQVSIQGPRGVGAGS